MDRRTIRPLVIGVFRHAGRILVAAIGDPDNGVRCYRPLGGEIEFGEHSRDALIREMREEIGAEITALRLLGTLENRFVFDGQRHHEIVLVYDAAFVDRALYTRPLIEGHNGNVAIRAEWKPLDEFIPGHPPLVPDGLLDLLRAQVE